MLLKPRPRTEYALSGLSIGATRLRSGITGQWGWGRNVGGPTGRVLAPETMGPDRHFEPINVLLFGKQGTGKTLTQTALLWMMDQLAWQDSLGVNRGMRRVASNYYLRFAQERGPLGYEDPDWFVDENGEPFYGQLPVDPCDQEITARISSFPMWSRHRHIGITELADVFNVMLPNSREVRDFGSVIRQQRHLFTEFICDTNSPTEVARNTVVRQIDLMILPKPHFSTWSADLLVFDLKGQFTGDFGKHAGRIPPYESEADWELGIENLDTVKDDYNTYEITAPSWSKNRASIIQREYRNRPTWARAELARRLNQPPEHDAAPYFPSVPTQITPAIVDGMEQALLAAYKPPIPWEDAKRVLHASGVNRRADLEEWFTERGWQIYDDPKLGTVVRK